MASKKDPNRKTTIPVQDHVPIVNWLLENCSIEELAFLASLNRGKNRMLLHSLLTRLTDYNIHEAFYAKVHSAEDLLTFRAAKRGEVAGLKAFQRATEVAAKRIEELDKKNR